MYILLSHCVYVFIIICVCLILGVYTHRTHFLADGYLKYFGWCLYDKVLYVHIIGDSIRIREGGNNIRIRVI